MQSGKYIVPGPKLKAEIPAAGSGIFLPAYRLKIETGSVYLLWAGMQAEGGKLVFVLSDELDNDRPVAQMVAHENGGRCLSVALFDKKFEVWDDKHTHYPAVPGMMIEYALIMLATLDEGQVFGIESVSEYADPSTADSVVGAFPRALREFVRQEMLKPRPQVTPAEALTKLTDYLTAIVEAVMNETAPGARSEKPRMPFSMN